MGNTISESMSSLVEQTSEMINQSITDNVTGANSYVNQKVNSITQRVEDAEGNISTIKQNVTGITQRVEDNEDNVASLQTTAQGLQSQIESAEGNISTIQQNAQNLQSQITDNKGNITQLQQNVEGFKTTVTSQLENVNTAIEQNASDIELSANKIEELSNQKVISSITYYFYLSNSPTQLTGGSWVTTPPTWTEGKYYWQKTVTTYVNGSVSESDPVCMTGNTGKGIKSTSVTYQASSSGTTIPTGSWSNTIPTVSPNQYLWTKTLITYTDNSTSVSYSIGKVGGTGASGSDGKGIKSISERYAVGTSNTTAPTSWSTTVSTMTEQNRYLWNYEIVTYTDNSTEETSKRVIGVYGSKGNSGDDGRGIQSITNYYLASSSSSGVTTSTSGWTTNVQTTNTTKRYLWNYEKVTYTDDQSITVGPRIIGTHGATGSQGLKGDRGDDGKTLYTWLKYADTPTSGMSDTPGGKTYIGLAYNKETSTESNNYSDYTWSLIKGEDGAVGPAGDDGKTLYTWIKYADNASGGGMSDSPEGKEYIGLAYNKETATESNTATDYTWSLIKGSDGADGRGIKSTATTYQASTNGTNIPTGNWSTSIPSVAANQYLWTRTIITYTDDTTSTAYSVGRMGANGKDGNDGRSIASMTVEFYLSTSKTTQTGGSWTTTPPEWEKGKYLWTRSKIVYENPTSTEYTTPVCDTSWEAANDVADDLHNNYYNKTETEAKIQVASESITSTVKTTVTEEIEKIEIGGRNLLKNSSLRVDTNEWETDPSTTSNVTVSQTEKDNNTCTLIDSSTLSTSDYHFWQNLDVGKLELNATYTASLWILAENVSKSNAGGTAACQFEITNAQTSGVDLHYHQKVLDNGYADWTKLSWTFTVTNATLTTASTIYFGLYLKNTTGDFYIRDIQLEKGSIATDWAPAPEDLATSETVQNVQTTADNANSVATSTESRVTVAESTIQQLSDAISSLVVDENGESMMTQTSDGWRFEMGSINSQLNEAKDQLNELSGEMTQADEIISNLNDLANDLSEKTAYITMTTDDEGNPCIELGKSDNEFKVRITNTSIDFMQGGLKMAYFSNNSLYIEKAIIKNELQIGEGNGFIWKTRSNGHLGLRYVEGVSS